MYAKNLSDSQMQNISQISYQKRLDFARDFVSKLKADINRANEWLSRKQGDGAVLSSSATNQNEGKEQNFLQDGELLLLQTVLDNGIRPERMITGQMHNGKTVISLRDFADVLRLAIDVAPDGRKADGWYIREGKTFHLDVDKKEVVTDHGRFDIADDVLVKDGDIFVPADRLGEWLGMDMSVDIAYQSLRITGNDKFPIQEELERKKNRVVNSVIPKPSLPLGGKTYTMASVPLVDVSTRSTYKKESGNSDREVMHNAYVTTVGDFAKGTLRTQSYIDSKNQLKRVRATYQKDSLKGDLLGSLKAKRLEVGDITTVRTPLGGATSRELGVHITNADPLRNFSRPTTVISGNAIPGWDVELYRNNQLLRLVHIDDSGFYKFEDISLYQDDNNFRLMFYGPQGERHEEKVFVPFDRKLLSRGDGVYDVSVSFNGQSAYVKDSLKNSNIDRGSVDISALYEKPLAEGITGSVGVRSNEQGGERDYVGSVGVSLNYEQSLINANVAVDDEGDEAAEFSIHRDFGDHQLSNVTKWRGANFDEQAKSTDFNSNQFRNTLNVNGPLPIGMVFSPYYSASLDYVNVGGGDSLISSNFGINGNYRNVSVGGNLRYKTGNKLDDDVLDSTVNVSGRKGSNFLRMTANYKIKPESKLEMLSASYSKDLTDKIEADFMVTKNQNQSLVEYEARLDWQAGFVRISPSVRYDTNEEFYAGLSTRFGLVKEPISGDIRMFDRNITSYAFASAFVYLDKNGDGVFNGQDKPLDGVVVRAPQNGTREKTDKDGIALFSRMTNLKLTDLFVDKETLKDPAWIPGFKGVSILPRKGYVARVEFPIHMSGELDGVVYANATALPDDVLDGKGDSTDIAQIEPASGVAPEEGEEEKYNTALEKYQKDMSLEPISRLQKTAKKKTEPVPLRNVELQLYNDKGEVEKSVVTDSDGFYYFSSIPPGRYYLMISEKSARRKNIIRPKPEPIEITYQGTVIYDHKIFVDLGAGDVPSEIIANLKDYKKRHQNVHFDDDKVKFILNFGEYNSRLLMALVWYKLRSRYGNILGDSTKPMVLPSESYADIKTGKHVLRVALKDKTIDDAYSMCRSFMARGQYCKVEITPSYMSKDKEDEDTMGGRIMAHSNERESKEPVKLAKATIASGVALPKQTVSVTWGAGEGVVKQISKEASGDVSKKNIKETNKEVSGDVSKITEAKVVELPEKIKTLDISDGDKRNEEAVALSKEQIRQEEEAAIAASALDNELIRQMRERIEATASAAATGMPINIAEPSQILLP